MVMAIAFGVATVFTALGAAFLVRSLNEGLLGSRNADRQSAFYLAEAGIDRALAELKTNSAWAGTGPLSLTTGAYEVTVTTLSPTRRGVTSTGHFPSSVTTTPGYQQRRVEAVFELAGKTVYDVPLMTDEELTVTGSMQSDSYNSCPSPDPANPSVCPAPVAYGALLPDGTINKSQHGNIGTNGTDLGDITLGNSVFIEGQLLVGPGVDPPESIVTGYNPALITGEPEVVSQPVKFPMPAMCVPAGLTCTELKLTGQVTQTLTSTGGPLGDNRYCYTNVTLSGGATLSASSDVIVYVTGNLVTKGNATLGNSTRPSHLAVVMTSDNELRLETGSSKIYSAIYGPDVEVTIGGTAELFGALIVEEVEIPGSAVFHYDEDLKRRVEISNGSTIKLLSWRDLN
jgi:hypothetical protein